MNKSALLVAVIIGAIVFTVLIVKTSNRTKITTPRTLSSVSPTKSTEMDTTRPSTDPNDGTSSEVKRLLKLVPDANASQAKINSFFEEVSKSAVATNSIEISECSIKPAVVKVEKGSTVTFTNSGNVTRRLTYTTWNLDISAKGKKELKVTGGGVQGYTCDKGPIGLIYVLE